MAALGLEDFQQGTTPARRLAGIRNAVVWGRAVTNVLEHIRTFERDAFNAWYAPRSAALQARPDFKYLYELRSQILKEGLPLGTAGSAYIGHLNTADLAQMAKPANARGLLHRGPPGRQRMGGGAT